MAEIHLVTRMPDNITGFQRQCLPANPYKINGIQSILFPVDRLSVLPPNTQGAQGEIFPINSLSNQGASVET